MINFSAAKESDVPRIAALLSHGVSRKNHYNDSSWGDQPFSEEEVHDMLTSSTVYVAYIDDDLAAVASVTESDPLWQEQTEKSAYYIHRMTTDKRYKGQNIGGQLLEWLASVAKANNVHVLRLDCDFNNRGLCSYYLQQGFTEHTRKDLHNKLTGKVDSKALFEKKVA